MEMDWGTGQAQVEALAKMRSIPEVEEVEVPNSSSFLLPELAEDQSAQKG